METPEGVNITILKPEHPIVAGIPWDECPVFEGFNKIVPKEEADVVATIGQGEDEHPLIVTWEFGQGQAMAFATDCTALGSLLPAVGVLRTILATGGSLAGEKAIEK